jgi:hypothetical protein
MFQKSKWGKSLSSLTLIVMMSILGMSCSSTKKERVPEDVENEDIQKDYKVKDASSNIRPGWIEDAEVWAGGHGKDTAKYRFFSYETDPKVSRNISCNLAKANTRVDIASEITTFIDKSLGFSQEGNASVDENNPQVVALREYVENTLAEKVQALIHGAAVVKTYWEKRRYLKSEGAKKDYNAYTCAVLIRMSSKRLKNAVDEAANHVVSRVDDPETKAQVKKALDDASENFDKRRQGL